MTLPTWLLAILDRLDPAVRWANLTAGVEDDE